MDPSTTEIVARNQVARVWFATGCLMMAVAVALGAFGAHGLESQLSGTFDDVPRRLETWGTASNYQLLHGIGLLCLGIVLPSRPVCLTLAACLLLAGVFLFSGSLYCLAVSEWRFLGRVAPVGGLSLILGWGLAAVGMLLPAKKAIQQL